MAFQRTNFIYTSLLFICLLLFLLIVMCTVFIIMYKSTSFAYAISDGMFFLPPSTVWIALGSNYLPLVLRHSQRKAFLLQLTPLWWMCWCRLKGTPPFPFHLHENILEYLNKKVSVDIIESWKRIYSVLRILIFSGAAFLVYLSWAFAFSVFLMWRFGDISNEDSAIVESNQFTKSIQMILQLKYS